MPQIGANLSILVKTERLCLRRIEVADLPSLGRIYTDRECMRFYSGTKSPAEIHTWFQKLAFDSYDRHGFGLWAVINASSGEVIGDCGITLQNTPAGSEPEIGYHLWRDFWGKGFATEAVGAALAWGGKNFPDKRITCMIDPGNTASLRVAARLGFREFARTKFHGEPIILLQR